MGAAASSCWLTFEFCGYLDRRNFRMRSNCGMCGYLDPQPLLISLVCFDPISVAAPTHTLLQAKFVCYDLNFVETKDSDCHSIDLFNSIQDVWLLQLVSATATNVLQSKFHATSTREHHGYDLCISI